MKSELILKNKIISQLLYGVDKKNSVKLSFFKIENLSFKKNSKFIKYFYNMFKNRAKWSGNCLDMLVIIKKSDG